MTDAPKPAAHSPAPWRMRVDPYPDGVPFVHISAGEGCHDLHSDGSETGFHLSGIFSVANARLMTASPLLLAALERVRDEAGTDSPEMWDQVAAAIAAARGQPTEPEKPQEPS